MKKRMFGLYTAAAVFGSTVVSTAGAAVIMTGLVDPTYDTGGRSIEFFTTEAIDFTATPYVINRFANSNTTADGVINLDTGTAAANTFFYAVSNQADFQTAFGTSLNIVEASGNLSGNGNDSFQLTLGGVALDTIGGVIGDATDIYEDSYLYRLDNTGPDGGSYVAANFTVPGNDVLDGVDAAGTAAIIPFGTYVIPEPASLALVGLGGLVMLGRGRRQA